MVIEILHFLNFCEIASDRRDELQELIDSINYELTKSILLIKNETKIEYLYHQSSYNYLQYITYNTCNDCVPYKNKY